MAGSRNWEKCIRKEGNFLKLASFFTIGSCTRPQKLKVVTKSRFRLNSGHFEAWVYFIRGSMMLLWYIFWFTLIHWNQLAWDELLICQECTLRLRRNSRHVADGNISSDNGLAASRQQAIKPLLSLMLANWFQWKYIGKLFHAPTRTTSSGCLHRNLYWFV